MYPTRKPLTALLAVAALAVCASVMQPAVAAGHPKAPKAAKAAKAPKKAAAPKQTRFDDIASGRILFKA